MGYGGGSGGSSTLSGDSDVTLSSPQANDLLAYNTSSHWQNTPMVGTVALATGGGQEKVQTMATASGAKTLNLANANVFNVTMTGNVTFTFSGATSGQACSFALYLHQDSTGSRTVTWPATGVLWAGGTAPALTQTASATDVLVFETIDGGTTWYGSLVGANFS